MDEWTPPTTRLNSRQRVRWEELRGLNMADMPIELRLYLATRHPHNGDEIVECIAEWILLQVPAPENPAQLAVGTVLRADSPMPPDGTVLMMPEGTWERLDSHLIQRFGGATRWPLFANKYGPFVVGPDVDTLVNG